MRRCNVCTELKPLSSFNKDKEKREGRAYTCKDCNLVRAKVWAANNPHRTALHRRTYKYGLTANEIEQLLDAQYELCKICEIYIGDDFHVDHNHKTGKVRGLLCPNCNKAMGMLRENVHTLARMIEYLT